MLQKVLSIVRMHIIVAGLTALMICSSVIIGTPVAKASTLDEMQSQMAALMSQIVALQSHINTAQGNGGTVGEVPRRPQDGTQSSTTLNIGTKIITTEAVRVRSAAGRQATIIATQPAHVEGVIVEGPVVMDGYRWFKVDYATGADGWNAGFRLKANTQNEAGAWAHPLRLGMDGMLGSSSELQGKITALQAKLTQTTDGAQRQEITAILARLLGQRSSSTEPWKPNVNEMFDAMRKSRASTTVEFRPHPRATSTSERGGAVLGASTDVFLDISRTIDTIKGILQRGVTQE